jgi:hypothetical protein
MMARHQGLGQRARGGGRPSLLSAAWLLAVCVLSDGSGAAGRVGGERTSRGRSREVARSLRRLPAASSADARTDGSTAAPTGLMRPLLDEQKARYFGRISIAGAISCSVTHSLVVPLDVIKTRMQTDADISSMRAAAVAIFRQGSGSGLLKGRAFFNGLGATATGYWLQGAAKFGAQPMSPCPRSPALGSSLPFSLRRRHARAVRPRSWAHARLSLLSARARWGPCGGAANGNCACGQGSVLQPASAFALTRPAASAPRSPLLRDLFLTP